MDIETVGRIRWPWARTIVLRLTDVIEHFVGTSQQAGHCFHVGDGFKNISFGLF